MRKRPRKNSDSEEDEPTEKPLEFKMTQIATNLNIDVAKTEKKKKSDNNMTNFDWWVKYALSVEKIYEERVIEGICKQN